jgi:hypothetical protein
MEIDLREILPRDTISSLSLCSLWGSLVCCVSVPFFAGCHRCSLVLSSDLLCYTWSRARFELTLLAFSLLVVSTSAGFFPFRLRFEDSYTNADHITPVGERHTTADKRSTPTRDPFLSNAHDTHSDAWVVWSQHTLTLSHPWVHIFTHAHLLGLTLHYTNTSHGRTLDASEEAQRATCFF